MKDIANAPTTALAEREGHRIATLGHNHIIQHCHRTQALSGRERVTVALPKEKRPRQVISAAIRKIFGLSAF